MKVMTLVLKSPSLTRRGFVMASGASLMSMVPPGVRSAAWAAGSDAPEKKEVRIGFIPLTDCASVLMVTHDVDEAVLLADRIVMLTNGPAATILRGMLKELVTEFSRLNFLVKLGALVVLVVRIALVFRPALRCCKKRPCHCGGSD